MTQREAAKHAKAIYQVANLGTMKKSMAITLLRRLYPAMSDTQQRKARDFFDAWKFAE